jgi:TIR domain
VILLSYARADAPLVDYLYDQLTQDGLDLWLDRRRLVAGEPWLASIASAIDSADCVIVVGSQYSARSVHVRWEHERAVAAGKRVHVVRIDDGTPRLTGTPNESLHDLRIDPLDPTPWLKLARGQSVPTDALEVGPRVQPAYVRASARAAAPVMALLLASAGVFALAGAFADELGDTEPANPALFTVLLPSALVFWAIPWEVRRVRLLRLRRLRSNRNAVLPRVLGWSAAVAGLMVVAIYWWAVVVALLVAVAASKFRRGELEVFGRRIGRRGEAPSRPDELPTTRLAKWSTARVRSALKAYESPKLEAWLPAFVERSEPSAASVNEGALRLHETAAAASPDRAARAPALVYADPDVLVAERLAAALRTQGVELVPLSRVHSQERIAKIDGAIFLLTRFSQKALAKSAAHLPLVIVSFGPARIPDSMAHLQVLDMTTREAATVAEAVDETLATGRHGQLDTAVDRRSSFLGVPSGVGGFVTAYLAMFGFLGFLLMNGILEQRDVAAIALPVTVLSGGWLYFVLSRRAPLTLGLLTTAVIVGLIGLVIARHSPSLNNFFVLVVPGLWIYFHYSAMRNADRDVGDRSIDLWAPRMHLNPLAVVAWLMGCVAIALTAVALL